MHSGLYAVLAVTLGGWRMQQAFNHSGFSFALVIHRFGWCDTSYEHDDNRTEPTTGPRHPVIWPAGAVVPGPGLPGRLLCSPAAHPNHFEGEAAVSLGNSHSKCDQDTARCS